MDTELKEIILRQCRKKIIHLELFDEEEEEEREEEEEEEVEGIKEEESKVKELPFEDILATKRRRYSYKEEFIFILYNDMLKYFVKEWDGRYLRKKPRRKIDVDSREISSDDEDVDKREDLEDVNVSKENDNNFEENADAATKLGSSCPWKLTLPDEFANVTFITNNTYSGRISRKMMEGEGVYRWSNGAHYKGDFERNCMHGKGLLEWDSVCWYEGDFANGYPHGRGIMVDGENHYMYTGQWHKGRRHGKGYSRYEDNGSYDGDWTMDKMNGTGLRIYPSGARYVGQWKNGVRHGLGTMVWTNGDVYRGEWKCGAMDGYGVYVWNGFFNKTFTWPQEVSYAGYWRHGMRHGKGDIKLNSVGGARYSGCWKNNKKHGHGIMIGNNGEKLESDSLFINDIFCASNIVDNTIKNETEVKYEQKCIRVDEEKVPQFVEKPEQLAETLVPPILKPEQFPCLSYHITRLLDPKSLEPPLVTSISSGKCYNCENKSCSCLPLSTLIDTNERKDFTRRNVSESHIENTAECNWKYEERWIYNCLTLHMSRLRQIYNDYAKLFTKSPPKCNLVMTRLCLWQLWRDCDIHEKGLNLAEIDTYIAKNETALVVDPHHPFERMEIWQFLHALLEVSWHLYTKHNDIEVKKMNGKIAAGLHKFLENDVYPRAGNHVGNLYCENQDLLPAYCVFELYQRIGYPPTANTLLRSMCAVKGTTSQSSSTSMDLVKNFPDAINSVTIGDKISYLLKSDGILSSPQYAINVSKEIESDPFNGLLAFKQLGAPTMIKIMAAICPGIKDGNNGVIMNMDYKLTFLEFYETLLEATRQLLYSNKKV